MQIRIFRVLLAIFVIVAAVGIFLLAVIDFSVVDIDNVEDPSALAEADYLKLQADYKDVLSQRTIGIDSAPLQFTLYSDFACDSCREFYQKVWSWLRFNYVQQNLIRFEFKFYPLVSVHPESLVVAQSSLCAAEQGDFWSYHDLLFERQSEWRQNVALTDYLIGLAKERRYRESTFRRCLLSGKYEQFVRLELADAIEKEGIEGAPTVVLVNGDQRKLIEGAVSTGFYEQELTDQLTPDEEAEDAEETEEESADAEAEAAEA